MSILELLVVVGTIVASSVVAMDIRESLRLIAKSKNQLRYAW